MGNRRYKVWNIKSPKSILQFDNGMMRQKYRPQNEVEAVQDIDLPELLSKDVKTRKWRK